MWNIFDNALIIQEARQSGRGGKLWKELLMTLLMVGVVFTILSIVELIPVLFAFVDMNNPELITQMEAIEFLISSLYARAFSATVFVLFCKFCQRRSFKSFGFNAKGCIIEYAKGLIVGFAIFSILILLGVLFGAFEFTGLAADINYKMILFVFGGFIIQGAQEEIICRGYVMTSIARKNNVWVAILVSAFVFAVLHMGNAGISVVAFINLVLFGVFMSVYMLRTNSIFGVCAIHTIWNFVQGSFYGLGVSGMHGMPTIFKVQAVGPNILTGGAFGPEGSIITTVLLAGGIALIVVPMMTKIKGDLYGQTANERNAAADQLVEEHREESGQGDGETN